MPFILNDSVDRERCLFLRPWLSTLRPSPPCVVRDSDDGVPARGGAPRHVAEAGTVRHLARYGPARRGHRHRVRAGEGHTTGTIVAGEATVAAGGDAELGPSTRVEEAAALTTDPHADQPPQALALRTRRLGRDQRDGGAGRAGHPRLLATACHAPGPPSSRRCRPARQAGRGARAHPARGHRRGGDTAAGTACPAGGRAARGRLPEAFAEASAALLALPDAGHPKSLPPADGVPGSCGPARAVTRTGEGGVASGSAWATAPRRRPGRPLRYGAHRRRSLAGTASMVPRRPVPQGYAPRARAEPPAVEV